MKKLAVILLALLAAAGFAWAETLPIIDPNLSGAIKGTSNAYYTVTTNFTSDAAGQLLIGTTNNLTRTVWIAVQAGSTNWTKIAP